MLRALSSEDKAALASVRTVTISPEALLCSFEHRSEKTAWPGIQRIAVTKDHILFFVMSQGGDLVPRRAFPSDQDFQQFADTALRFKKDADEQVPGTATSAPGGLPLG
jgi:hypothetical protein